MKLLFTFIAIGLFALTNYGQTIKIGENFEKYASNFKLSGISTKDNSHSYTSIKSIPSILYGRKVDKIIISTIDNIIVRKIYLLLPISTDIDIPISIVTQVENELSIKFAKKPKYYGAILDGVKISVSRNNDGITDYKDRIMVFFASR